MAPELIRLPFVPFLIMALSAAVAMLAVGAPVRAQAAAAICGTDVVNLMVQCHEYVMIPDPKREPSKPCCDALKDAHVACLCRRVPPEVLKMISTEKALYVAKCCGKSVPSGTKCGSSLASSSIGITT